MSMDLAAPPAPNGLALAAAQTLPRLPRELPPTHFDNLRRTALRSAQALAGERWTDYNLHDPGVTLLEAFAYAATELAYRTDLPIDRLLADRQGRWEPAGQGLHPPAQALPCRPTTAADLRRWLLDRVSGLDGVTLHPGAWPGVLDAELAPAEGSEPAALAAAVRREAAAVRMLGQELGVVRVLRRRPCALLGELRIEGARDPARIAAEVHWRCAAWLAAAPSFDSIEALRVQGLTSDAIWDGPPTVHGAAQPQRLPEAGADTVFIADLVRCARTVEGVADVAWLALQSEDGPAQHAAARRRAATACGAQDPGLHTAIDAGWQLVLAPPARRDTRLRLYRRGNAVDLDPAALQRHLHELQAAARARRAGARAEDGQRSGATRAPGAQAAAEPQDAELPVHVHVPLQQHLPTVYAVGAASLGSDAKPHEHRRAQQLQGYVALLDQWLAHATAQQRHWRTLFSVGPATSAITSVAATPSYAWHVLGAAELPDLAPLQDLPPSEIEARYCRPGDDAVARRSRMLDLLLALQGQAWSQHSLRQFMDHLPPAACEAELLALKQAFARDVCTLNRDRGAGFDPGRPAWDARGNTAGLQALCSLLLGRQPGPWSSLAQGLRGRELAEGDGDGAAASPGARPDTGAALLPLDLDSPAARRAAAQAAQRLQALPLARQRRLPGAVLRCAVRHDRWALRRSSEGWTLVLGPDEHGRHWAVATPQAAPAAPENSSPAPGGAEEAGWLQAMADAVALNRFAQALERGCEGLHVIEHLLLRPLAGTAAHAEVPATFHAHQVTVVLPGWTQRARRTAWRDLAAETLAVNVPAQLQLRCLWLDPDAMQVFEAHLQAWLQARLGLAQHADAAALQAHDHHAAALARWLLSQRTDAGDHGAAVAGTESGLDAGPDAGLDADLDDLPAPDDLDEDEAWADDANLDRDADPDGDRADAAEAGP